MEVEVTPAVSDQSSPHIMPPNSPKKRPFHEMDRPEKVHSIEPTSTSNLPAPQHPTPIPAPITANTTTNKKPKLTPAEKEAKERQKAEDKVRRDEEKRIREEKRRVKEEEKQAREEEKRKKEEEKKKKERAQMRLNAFFVKPASRPSQQPASEVTTAAETVVGQDGPSETSSTRVESTPTSDYIKEFPPFFVQSHVTVGPSHRFQRDADGLDHVRKKLDDIIKSEQTVESPKFNATELFSIRRYRRRQGRANGPTVREILASMQGSSTTPVDLTSDTGNTVRPEDMLKKIPVKILKYAEDVRPPYRGTFTKHIPDRDAVKLCRNPFARVISDFNYDYDSEAEWEEPEEGEDLDSDGGDDDPSEDDADDMDDFLDDTEDDVKRRNIVGSLEPICSGIRWADGLEVDPAFKPFRMEPLLDAITFPIDPFSTSYWKPAPSTKPPSKPTVRRVVESRQQQLLSPKLSSSASPKASSPLASITSTRPSGLTGPGSKSRAPFPPDQVNDFKAVVSGSDLTKAGLIELLKKRFPKVSKDVIKDTLTAVAVRQGKKEADKRWVLL